MKSLRLSMAFLTLMALAVGFFSTPVTSLSVLKNKASVNPATTTTLFIPPLGVSLLGDDRHFFQNLTIHIDNINLNIQGWTAKLIDTDCTIVKLVNLLPKHIDVGRVGVKARDVVVKCGTKLDYAGSGMYTVCESKGYQYFDCLLFFS